MSVVTRSTSVPTSDQHRAMWAYAYFSGGHHRNSKPRIRVKPRIRIR